MTREEADKTLMNLRLAIVEKAKQGLDVNEVRMGVELGEIFNAFNSCVLYKHRSVEKPTIYGIPVVCDYVNPMNLEIAVVEKICVEGS